MMSTVTVHENDKVFTPVKLFQSKFNVIDVI